MDELKPGAVVGQRYQLDRLIGEGGMGTVWAATHTITRKSVALKLLNGEDRKDARIRQRFLREARAACAVRHPNVVAIHDVLETEDGTPLMVMDLLEGESLAQRLARTRTMPLGDVARVLLPVVSAVGTAHALGIVHRDLKPDNIFLAREPDGRIDVKVLDFGIAKLTALEGLAASTSALTQDGGLLGTPFYMSPEQVDGEKDIDHRSDVWSLGIILYECLAGKVPTEGYNIGQVMKTITRGVLVPLESVAPAVPASIAAMVMKMLSRDRAERPTLHAIAEELRAYANVEVSAFGEPVAPLAHPSGPLPPATSTADRSGNVRIVASDPALVDAATLAATTRTGSLRPPPPRRRVGLLATLGAVLVVALAAGGWRLAHDRSPAAPPTAPATATATSTAISTPTPTATSTSTSISTPTATPTPTAMATATATVAEVDAGVRHVARPHAPPRGASAPPTDNRPGGVVEKPPF